MKNKLVRIISILFICLSLSSCKQEQTEDIYILYTNDVASEVNGQIGYAGVKGYLDEVRSEHPYVGLVDAGDFFDGSFARSSNGESIVKIMNEVGYDVVALGNQEFSIGLENLKNNIAASKFNYVSCNLKYLGSGKDPLAKVKPYVIKRYGPTKIAFIGVTTPETLTEGKEARAAIEKDGQLLYSFYEANEGEDLYEQVQKTIDKAKKRADYIIVLSHLGSNSVTEGFSSYDLIDNTSGIDVVIDGHSHTVIPGEGVYDKDGNNVVLTSTGKELENLGVLIIHPDRSFNTALYPKVYSYDQQVQSLIDELSR